MAENEMKFRMVEGKLHIIPLDKNTKSIIPIIYPRKMGSTISYVVHPAVAKKCNCDICQDLRAL